MFNLNKRLWKRRKINQLRVQLWDKEFTKRQLQEIKEGMRQQRDRIRDQHDAAGRKYIEAKYQLYYSETGDEVKVKDVPMEPGEILKLPDHKNKEHRFHKQHRPKWDKKVAANLEKFIERTEIQLKQLEAQIKEVNQKIKGPLLDEQGADHSIDGQMSGYQEVINLLKKYKI